MSTLEEFQAPPVLDDTQYIPLVVIQCTTSFLSVLGSGCIIYMSSRQLESVLQRLLLGLSISDFLSSASLFLMPFLMPSYFQLPGAAGNHNTCAAIGFVYSSFALSGAVYNGYLGGYYYLVVRRNYKEKDFQRYLEVIAHCVAFLVPIGIQVYALATESINPSPLLSSACNNGSYPWGCRDSDDLECTRSNETSMRLIVGASGLVLALSSALGLCCTIMVACTVRRVIKRSNAHSFRGTPNERANKRMRAVGNQAVLYCLAYFNTILWYVILVVLLNAVYLNDDLQEKKDEPGLYIFQIIFWTLYPLQGALNLFVYTRMQVARWRKVNPDMSICAIYGKILSLGRVPNKSTVVTSAPPIKPSDIKLSGIQISGVKLSGVQISGVQISGIQDEEKATASELNASAVRNA